MTRSHEFGHAQEMRTRLPPQVTLAEAAARWTLPEGSFYRFLADNLPRIASEAVVRGLFSDTTGRPSIAPEHLVAILLLRYFENLSYEQAAQKAQFDVRWKAVVGRAPAEPSPFVSDSTLQEFEDRLRTLGRHDALLSVTLAMASEAGWLETEVEVAQDSSPVTGKGAVKDTYNLLGDGIRKLIRGLAKAEGSKPLATAERFGVGELFRRSTKATADIDWSSPAARRGFLQRLVETAEALMAVLDPREPWALTPAVREAEAILRKVIAQDIECDTQGQVSLRQGVAEDRLISVHEPEMRRGHKTQSEPFEGYKFHHTVDLRHGLVLATEVTGANEHDSVPSEPMATQAEEASGRVVTKVIGDCAYGTEKNRAAHADAGRELVAKMPRVESTRLPKHAFRIDFDKHTVTCPEGVCTGTFAFARSALAVAGKERLGASERSRVYVFPPERCLPCPKRAVCVPNRAEARTIEIRPNEALFVQARAYQDTPAYHADRRARQIAERQVARMVKMGARVARVFGKAKVRAQIAMIAVVVNLTRLITLQAAEA